MKVNVLKWMSVLLLVISSATMTAQINLKIGYNAAVGSFKTTNDALAKYAPRTGEVTQPFKKLAFMHGIILGASYKIDKTSIEVSWDNLSRDRTAVSYNPATEAFAERAYDFSLNTLSLGVDRYFGRIGVGTALGRTQFVIKRPIASNDLSITKENHWSARVHVSWRVQQSRAVAMVIRPYYQMPLSDVSIAGLHSDIGIRPTSEEDTSVFGLSFLFYNGRQR